jgi:hypothetical protein
MQRGRLGLGLITGVLLAASSAAHSLLGWPQFRHGLSEAHAPADLIVGLSLGWQFAGVAMLVFGIIVILLFIDALKRRPVSLRPVLVIAIGYLVFGTWALTVSNLDPIGLVFLVPGALLLVAAWGYRGPPPPGD